MEFDLINANVHYHNITTDDMLNGDGLRVVLWLSGCLHQCEYCQNPITWDENDGIKFNQDAFEEIITELKKSHIKGITFSGGDPLHPVNRIFTGEFCKYLKEKFPTKDIWLYTGYVLRKEADEYKFVSKDEEFVWDYLNYVDFIVDGKFEYALRQADIKAKRTVHWRGSSNQRVIDIQNTLRTKTFVCVD